MTPRPAQQSNALSPELTRRAVGQTCLYALPNGEFRPAIVVRARDAMTADLRVFTAGKEDLAFFGGHGGVEFIANAPYSATGPPGGAIQVSHWSWPEQSLMATLWPHAANTS